MAERILFVGAELQSRVRIEAPAAFQGRVDTSAVTALPDDLQGYAVAVVDLDESGLEGFEALRSAGYGGRVVGFYSHVDESLGTRATEAGIEAYPRGRFWRELERIIAG